MEEGELASSSDCDPCFHQSSPMLSIVLGMEREDEGYFSVFGVCPYVSLLSSPLSLNFFSFPLAKDHHHACKTIQVHNLPPR
jgi:hypothetical protein